MAVPVALNQDEAVVTLGRNAAWWAHGLQTVASLLLLVAGGIVFVEALLEDDSGNEPVSDDAATTRQNALTETFAKYLAASCLAAQSLTGIMLVLPLRHYHQDRRPHFRGRSFAAPGAAVVAAARDTTTLPVALPLARAATSSTCFVSLVLVVTSGLALEKLCVLLGLAAASFVCSCATNMILYWPSSPSLLSSVHREMDSVDNLLLEQPLLLPTRSQDSGESEPVTPFRPLPATDLPEGAVYDQADGNENNHDDDSRQWNDIVLPADDSETDDRLRHGGTTNASPPGNDDDDQDVPATNRIRGTRRLLQLARPQVAYLYAGCAVLLLRLPFSLAMPHFVATTLVELSHQDFVAAQREMVRLFLVGSTDAALDFWCVFLFGYANQRIVKNLRLDLLSTLLRQEVAFFDTHSSGELASRLNSDCSEMASDLTWFFRFSIESVVRIVGITTYMLLRSPLLGMCAVSIVPLVAVINKVYGDWLRRNAMAVQDALAEANAVAQQALSNVRVVIAVGAEDWEHERYQRKIQRQYQLNVRQLYMTGVYYMGVSTFLINTVVQVALLWLGSRLIQDERLTSDVLLAFMLYQGQLQNETLNLFQSYSSLIKSSGAGDKVFGLLDRQPPAPATASSAVQARLVAPEDETEDDFSARRLDSHDDEELNDLDPLSMPLLMQPQNTVKRNHYDVRLKQVVFRYPSRPQHTVLNRLDLDIPKGTTVALTGHSGCGKTTIINLLQRFYDVSAGSIEIDGIDLRHLDLHHHRRHIGVVTQDPTLFDGTILENIAYASPGTTREEVVRAAKLANAHAFIRHFAHGYDTSVGERGVQLSGGQKQRIAIARALVHHPSLLLLDEATSALDAQSESLVQEALDRLLARNNDMTTVIIAHRLRTIRNADFIAVLDQGTVVEYGCHEELMQIRGGHYRKMVERAESTGMLPG